MLRAVLILVILFLGLAVFAQEAVKTSIPEIVKISLDGLQKTRTANGVFSIQYQNAYFWALEKAVYVNVVFNADLDSDVANLKNQQKSKYDEFVAAEMKKLEDINKKIKKEEDKKKWQPPALTYPEVFHDLYLRVLKNNQMVQEYRSHIPLGDEKSAYYSFGTILEPGEYELFLAINRFDNSQAGTQLLKLSVPELTVMEIIKPRSKIEISTPIFYADVKQLPQSEERFTVVKNKYQIGPARLDFYPWGNNPFKSTDKPILAFFMLGTVAVQGAEPWNISAMLEIRQGKEVLSKFKELKLTNPYFDQPIEFIKNDKNKTSLLPAGDYVLAIELKDQNKGGKGTVEIPFKIIE
jgi:hypothetical protein